MTARTKKKPAARKPSRPARPASRLGIVGWIATAGVAGAWAISDGRPLHYVQSVLPGAVPAIVDRVATLIDSDRTARPAPQRPARPQPVAAREEQTGSIRPTARPVIAPPRERMPPSPPPPRPISQVPMPGPAPAPMPPFAKPPLDEALRQAARPLPAGGAPSGGERHATRDLTAHAAPDGASAQVAEIGSGSSVMVLRAAGDWRYVRAPRSGVEGWIDGRFLAGEATPPAAGADPASFARSDLVGLRN